MTITPGIIDFIVRSATFILWAGIEVVVSVHACCLSDIQYYSRNCLNISEVSFYKLCTLCVMYKWCDV
jgi:hypothetical protein